MQLEMMPTSFPPLRAPLPKASRDLRHAPGCPACTTPTPPPLAPTAPPFTKTVQCHVMPFRQVGEGALCHLLKLLCPRDMAGPVAWEARFHNTRGAHTGRTGLAQGQSTRLACRRWHLQLKDKAGDSIASLKVGPRILSELPLIPKVEINSQEEMRATEGRLCGLSLRLGKQG